MVDEVSSTASLTILSISTVVSLAVFLESKSSAPVFQILHYVLSRSVILCFLISLNSPVGAYVVSNLAQSDILNFVFLLFLVFSCLVLFVASWGSVSLVIFSSFWERRFFYSHERYSFFFSAFMSLIVISKWNTYVGFIRIFWWVYWAGIGISQLVILNYCHGKEAARDEWPSFPSSWRDG